MIFIMVLSNEIGRLFVGIRGSFPGFGRGKGANGKVEQGYSLRGEWHCRELGGMDRPLEGFGRVLP